MIWRSTPFLACALGALALAACARVPGDPVLEDRPIVNAEDLGPGAQCVNTCQPDHGSAEVDCAAAEAGLEFFPAPVWDFEGSTVNLYGYTDGTSGFLATSTGACEQGNDCAPYDLVPSEIERCGQMTHAVHVRGGPFREWGGGVGRRLDSLASDAAAALDPADPNDPTKPAGSCPIPPPADAGALPFSFCPKDEPEIDAGEGVVLADGSHQPPSAVRNNYYTMIVDLSEWEGISFWARRGPDSQPGVRVVLGDRNTDDDAAFLMTDLGLTPRCRRYKDCGCKNHKPCSAGLNNALVCWDPAVDPPGTDYDLCGTSSCDDPYPAFPMLPDLSFSTAKNPSATWKGTNTCSFYAFNTDQTGYYCYDTVNGPPPAEAPERCGDPWIDPVRLDPDWTFYKVPFSELRQEGYGKRFSRLDVAGVTMVRFTWSVGWVDYWIDNVRFYRRKN